LFDELNRELTMRSQTGRSDQPPTTKENKAFLGLLLVASLAFGWILQPFYGAVLWSVIIALLFVPLHRWCLRKLKGRRSLSALLTLLIILFIVALPLAIVAAAMAREAATVYAQLQSGELDPTRYFRGVYDALPPWVTATLDRFGLSNVDLLQRRITLALSDGTKYIATQVFNLGQSTFEFVASLFVTTYLAFFLIRDGSAISRTIRNAIPLSDTHKKELIAKFTTVIRAVVKGNMLVAGIQGALGGVAFWFLGVSGALLWAVLMAFLSLLPAVGAGLVWVPVTAYLFLTGAYWQAFALAAWGILVVGLVDNLLRPILVGKETRMPDYLVMIATLGGITIFGINGFVLGPAIAAMFIATWHIYVADQTHREG
jgi:predicted PurR-regulated permease PerM